MNLAFRPLFVAAIWLMSCAPASANRATAAPAQIVWSHSLSAALAQASSEHKMIITDLVADWCGWCKVMEKETWAQPAVGALNNQYVFLKLDIEKDPDGIALARRFKIDNLPVVLLLTAAGEEFERLEQFLPAQAFLDKLKAALADPESLGNIRAAQVREPQNIELHYKLAYELFKRANYAEAEVHFAQIVQQDPQNKFTRTDASLFYQAACMVDVSDTDKCLATLERLRKEFPASKIVPSTFLLAAQALLRVGKRPEARQQVNAFLEKYPAHPLVPKAKELLLQIGN